MCYFCNPDKFSFLSDTSTPQKQFSNNYFDNSNLIPNKLFTDINSQKKAKNIFLNTSNNYNEKNYFSQNIFENKYIPNYCNSYNSKDSTIGIIFNGNYSKINTENVNFMSITSLPEFFHGSFEEFRLADFEKKKTGNIIYYKVKKTSSLTNTFFSSNNDADISNYKYKYNNNNYCLENSGINNSDNIFNRKLESKLFKFKNNSNNQKNNNTLFKSNIVENDDNIQRKSISFPVINNYNSPFSYLENSINNNNFLKSSQSEHRKIQKNKTNNNKQSNIQYDDIDIYRLLSPNEKLTKEINEAIKNEKTVKEFLEELQQKYQNTKNSEIENDNYSFISQNNSFTSDIYGSLLSNSSNSNGAKIEIKNPFKEIEMYNMEIENDINYDKLASKINKIYGINNTNKNKFNCLNNNKFNGLNNNNNYRNNKLNTINEERNENEYIFNKIFSNGFPNYNTLLKNPFNTNNSDTKDNISKNINDLNYTTKNISKNHKHIRNKSNIFIGRDEALYQKTLGELNKLIISKFSLNEDNDNINKGINKNNNNIFFVKNNEGNDNNKMQYINLNINYNLFNVEKKEKNQNITFHKLVLENINQMSSVKDIKEQIKQRVYEELIKKNKYNYSIQNITLLTYLYFFSDENILLDYKLDNFDYTLQAYIDYKINKFVPKLTKNGYKCSPSIFELSQKSSKELKKVENFKIFNNFGEVEFKEPVNLLGVDLDKEITIKKNCIETSDMFNYWSIFKLYDFIEDDNDINNYKKEIEKSGGKFISYENSVLIWEYKEKK